MQNSNISFVHWRASLSSAKTASVYTYLQATHQNKSLLILDLKMLKIHIKIKKEQKNKNVNISSDFFFKCTIK